MHRRDRSGLGAPNNLVISLDTVPEAWVEDHTQTLFIFDDFVIAHFRVTGAKSGKYADGMATLSRHIVIS